MIKLEFVVRNAPTKIGQALYLIGNKSQLGDWQVRRYFLSPHPIYTHSSPFYRLKMQWQ